MSSDIDMLFEILNSKHNLDCIYLHRVNLEDSVPEAISEFHPNLLIPNESLYKFGYMITLKGAILLYENFKNDDIVPISEFISHISGFDRLPNIPLTERFLKVGVIEPICITINEEIASYNRFLPKKTNILTPCGKYLF